jgi:hypothetical protein
VHWMQDNGKWLMVDDIWNSDTPLPTRLRRCTHAVTRKRGGSASHA